MSKTFLLVIGLLAVWFFFVRSKSSRVVENPTSRLDAAGEKVTTNSYTL